MKKFFMGASCLPWEIASFRIQKSAKTYYLRILLNIRILFEIIFIKLSLYALVNRSASEAINEHAWWCGNDNPHNASNYWRIDWIKKTCKTISYISYWDGDQTNKCLFPRDDNKNIWSHITSLAFIISSLFSSFLSLFIWYFFILLLCLCSFNTFLCWLNIRWLKYTAMT